MARDAAELKASLKCTQNEVDNINKSLHEKSNVLDDIVIVQHEIVNGTDCLENQTYELMVWPRVTQTRGWTPRLQCADNSFLR